MCVCVCVHNLWSCLKLNGPVYVLCDAEISVVLQLKILKCITKIKGCIYRIIKRCKVNKP